MPSYFRPLFVYLKATNSKTFNGRKRCSLLQGDTRRGKLLTFLSKYTAAWLAPFALSIQQNVNFFVVFEKAANRHNHILHSLYTKLYAPYTIHEKESDAFWENMVLPQMSSAQAESLIKPITIEEVRNAMKQSINNKAPGPDGLTNEFYKILGPKLEGVLMAIFNSFLHGEELPLYFNSILLKVLHKPGRDPDHLGHRDQFDCSIPTTNYIPKYW